MLKTYYKIPNAIGFIPYAVAKQFKVEYFIVSHQSPIEKSQILEVETIRLFLTN